MKLGAVRVLVLQEGVGASRRVRIVLATGEEQLQAASLAIVTERAEAGLYAQDVGAANICIRNGGEVAWAFLLDRRGRAGEGVDLRFAEEP